MNDRIKSKIKIGLITLFAVLLLCGCSTKPEQVSDIDSLCGGKVSGELNADKVVLDGMKSRIQFIGDINKKDGSQTKPIDELNKAVNDIDTAIQTFGDLNIAGDGKNLSVDMDGGKYPLNYILDLDKDSIINGAMYFCQKQLQMWIRDYCNAVHQGYELADANYVDGKYHYNRGKTDKKYSTRREYVDKYLEDELENHVFGETIFPTLTSEFPEYADELRALMILAPESIEITNSNGGNGCKLTFNKSASNIHVGKSATSDLTRAYSVSYSDFKEIFDLDNPTGPEDSTIEIASGRIYKDQILSQFVTTSSTYIDKANGVGTLYNGKLSKYGNINYTNELTKIYKQFTVYEDDSATNNGGSSGKKFSITITIHLRSDIGLFSWYEKNNTIRYLPVVSIPCCSTLADIIKKCATGKIFVLNPNKEFSLSQVRDALKKVMSTSATGIDIAELSNFYIDSKVSRTLMTDSNGSMSLDGIGATDFYTQDEIPLNIRADSGDGVYLGKMYVRRLKTGDDSVLAKTRGISGLPEMFIYADSGHDDYVNMYLTTYPIDRFLTIKKESDESVTFKATRSGMVVDLTKEPFSYYIQSQNGNFERTPLMTGSQHGEKVYVYGDSSIERIHKENNSGVETPSVATASKFTKAYFSGVFINNADTLQNIYDFKGNGSKANRIYLLDYLEGVFAPGMYEDEAVVALGRWIRLDATALKSTSKIKKGSTIGEILGTSGVLDKSDATGSKETIAPKQLISCKSDAPNVERSNDTFEITGIQDVKFDTNSTDVNRNGLFNMNKQGGATGTELGTYATPTMNSQAIGNMGGSYRVGIKKLQWFVRGSSKNHIELECIGQTTQNSQIINDSFDVASNVEVVAGSTYGGASGGTAVSGYTATYSVHDEDGRVATITIDLPDTYSDKNVTIRVKNLDQMCLSYTDMIEVKNIYIQLSTLGVEIETTHDASEYKVKTLFKDGQLESGEAGVTYTATAELTLSIMELKTTIGLATNGVLAQHEKNAGQSQTGVTGRIPKLFVLGHWVQVRGNSGFVTNWLNEGAEADSEGDGNLAIWCEWLKAWGYENYPCNLDDIQAAIIDVYNRLQRIYNFSEAQSDYHGITFNPELIAAIQDQIDRDQLIKEGGILRTISLIVGIILWVYGFALFIAWAIDAGVKGEGNGLLYVVTFGKMKAATGVSRKEAIQMSTEGYKYTTIGMLLPRMLLLFAVAIILTFNDPVTLVGRLIEFVSGVYTTVRDTVFGNNH